MPRFNNKPVDFPSQTKMDRYGKYNSSPFLYVDEGSACSGFWIWKKPIRNIVFLRRSANFLSEMSSHINLDLAKYQGDQYSYVVCFKFYDLYGEEPDSNTHLHRPKQFINMLTDKLREIQQYMGYVLDQDDFKKSSDGIMPGDSGYFPLNEFWNYAPNNSLAGAYKSPQARLREYLKAVSNTDDPKRIEKLDIF